MKIFYLSERRKKNLQYRYLKRNTMSLSTGMQKQSINNKKVEDSEKLQNYF